MTLEEAIKHLRNDWFMSLGGQLCVDEDKKDAFLEAVGMGIKALRPVSRERVEKVFGGKWEEETYTTVSGRGRVIHSKKYTCSVCGKANGRAKTNFCPHCGASQTDEAVQMVMERMEALKDGSTTD